MKKRHSMIVICLFIIVFHTITGCSGGSSDDSTMDNETPSIPENLSATGVSSSRINLTWDSASDNVSVAEYRIYRNNSFISTTTATTFSDIGLSPEITYTYQVSASDPSSNESEKSVSDSATTLSEGSDSTGVKAFPGAQGFGALATGGRGGRVIKVTTLNASGTGSLQEALNVNEPRIIVFDVSGVIEADIIIIPYGNVTIAGQTSPGGGITIKGRLYGAYQYGVDNMIIRHLRIRPEFDAGEHDGETFDSIQFSRNRLLIFDHMSVAFGVDETIDIYSAQDVTVQWSTIEMSGTSGHPEGEHNYGLISGPNGGNVSIHHTFFAHHKNRCPAIANGPSEVINNVIYNVRHGFVHHNDATGRFNIIGNHFIDGSDDRLIPFYFDTDEPPSGTVLSYYLTDNLFDDPSEDCNGIVNNPWTECTQNLYIDESYRSTLKFDFTDATQYYQTTETQSAESIFTPVTQKAGAFPRDIVTLQAVSDATNGTGSWGSDFPADYMAGLSTTAPETDSDNDGMPDTWETANSLNPSDGTDHTTLMNSGYTAIEEYINECADELLQ